MEGHPVLADRHLAEEAAGGRHSHMVRQLSLLLPRCPTCLPEQPEPAQGSGKPTPFLREHLVLQRGVGGRGLSL